MDPQDQTNSTFDINAYRAQYSQYARQLLSDLGLGELIEPERGQLLAGIERYVSQVLTNTLLENLHDEQLDEAEAIIDRGGEQEELIAYFLDTIPEIDVKVGEALAAAYDRLLSESKQLASAIAGRHVDGGSATPPAPETT